MLNFLNKNKIITVAVVVLLGLALLLTMAFSKKIQQQASTVKKSAKKNYILS
jgi:hypothetical protein